MAQAFCVLFIRRVLKGERHRTCAPNGSFLKAGPCCWWVSNANASRQGYRVVSASWRIPSASRHASITLSYKVQYNLPSFLGWGGHTGCFHSICSAEVFWTENSGRMLRLTTLCSKYFLSKNKTKCNKPNKNSPSFTLLSGHSPPVNFCSFSTQAALGSLPPMHFVKSNP